MIKLLTKLLIIFSLILIVGCEKPDDKTVPLGNNKAEKSATIVKFFNQTFVPPSQILDAEMLEESLGTNARMAPGPVDYTRFYRITIAPNTIQNWTKNFSNLPEKTSFVKPKNLVTWWPTSAQFNALDFYRSEPLMSQDGWVAVDKSAGFIYILTVTN